MMNNLFFPSTYETLIQHSHNQFISQQQQQQQHWLNSTKIVELAQQIKHPTDPIKSFWDREQANKNNDNDDDDAPYFNITPQQLQQIVNRNNIQTRLSRKQLDELKINGYRKIKVHYIYTSSIIIIIYYR